ncbi:MAG: hypothetical protein IPL46_04545 [Saprospiraceae bacterium]|nr:hypothetical protein [Saprospiraceae bacterium]
MPKTRQLAAIMFTDIVGCTALMGNDEHKAFELLNKNRQIHKPIIEEYNVRFIKELGEAVMANFNSVSDAVTAAIKIQEVCGLGLPVCRSCSAGRVHEIYCIFADISG